MSSTPAETVIHLPAKVLGGADAVTFSEHLRSLVAEGHTSVVVDLAAVEVMNSSGLGMLVAGHSTLRRAGGSLSFRNIPETVQTLLRMTHLDTVFQLSNGTRS